MDPDRSITRIFTVLGGILGILAAIASLAMQSWMPLLAVGVVMLCVMGLTLSESAIFAPLLSLVMHAGDKDRKGKAKPTPQPPGQETKDPTRPQSGKNGSPTSSVPSPPEHTA